MRDCPPTQLLKGIFHHMYNWKIECALHRVVPKGLARAWRLWISLPLMILLTVSFATSVQDKQSQNTPSQISVRLTAHKKVFTLGESIIIRVHVTNVGNDPVLVQNFLSTSRKTPSRIQFDLRDSHGRSSPSVEFTDDIFSPRVATSPAVALLRSWLLLYPECSLVVDVPLDRELFAFLGKPGKYSLSGNYFSSGLLYPSAYRGIGLTEEDVRSLPFQSWAGHISTNTMNFEIVPVKAHL